MTYSHIKGILLAALLATLAIYLSTLTLSHLNLSPLIWGVLIGLVLGNLPGPSWSHPAQKGLHFCSKQILRLGIILYGFRITVDGLFAVGWEGLAFSLFTVLSTLLLGCYLGEKLLKLDRQTAFLTAIGSAICGAAAVLAAESVSRAKPYQAAAAVGTVVLFGTIAMLLYPILFTSGILGFSPWQYGFYTGATVHEVAHVVAAGEAGGSAAAAEIAVIVKMTRVLLLAPILILASLWFNKASGAQRMPLYIPWFVLGFILCIGINSIKVVPPHAVAWIQQLDLFLLTMAMAALGINTRLRDLAALGLLPFYLGAALFAWLLLSGWVVTILFI